MARRYDVYMEGRPLVIADSPPDVALPDQWLLLRIHALAELRDAVRSFVATTDIKGLFVHGLPLKEIWDAFRADYVFVQAAGGAVTDEQGRLLVIRRLGTWDLPKGKVDPGEGIPEAAIREVNEECGLHELRITGELPCTWHTYERKGRQHLKRTDWYLMRGSSTEALVPQHEEDIEEVRWMTKAEVRVMKGDTYPSLLPVVEAWEVRTLG